MTEQATWAMGTQLLRGGVGGIPISKMTKVGGLNLDSDEVDVTALDSPGGYEEVVRTIRRTGEVDVEGFYVASDAGQTAMFDDYNSDDAEDWAIVFPARTGTAWLFNGWVKGIVTGAEVGGMVPFNGKLRVTGMPTIVRTQSTGMSALAIVDSVGAVTLSPTFAIGTFLYIGTVADNTETWIKATATAADHTITVNGTTLTTGDQSGELEIGAAGTNKLFKIKVQETGKIPKVYEVYIIRPA